MQRMRYQFFAGTRFAINHNGCVGVGQPPYGTKHLLHRRCLAQDIRDDNAIRHGQVSARSLL